MANSIYELGRQAFADGSVSDISWIGDDIKAVLVDTDDYTVDLDADEFLSDIPAGARVATSGNFASKTATKGVCDAADITFSSVSGDISEALVIYQDTGTATTSRLIAYIDTATGLPITPNGADIIVSWSDGASKIFKL